MNLVVFDQFHIIVEGWRRSLGITKSNLMGREGTSSELYWAAESLSTQEVFSIK